ncbi:DUF5685 family protein [Desulfococcaceae bacterium HSG7]|nr:DUF5685 family protein [Desulfococcaceae bacterium HSG7]
MFGIFKGRYLNCRQRRDWMAHLCGICLALKNNYGFPARMAVNTDGVALSVLCEAQADIPFPRSRHRCPLNGYREIDIVRPDAVMMSFAAMISVLSGAAKINDHIEDNDSRLPLFPLIFKKISHKWEKLAVIHSKIMGFDSTAITSQFHRQSLVEQTPARNFSYYTGPTETAAAAAGEFTAVIAGKQQNRDSLHKLGRMYGRILFLLDSYRDYSDDLAQHKFNVLARTMPYSEIKALSGKLFLDACDTIKTCLEQMDMPRPHLAKSVFTLHLKQIGSRSLAVSPGEPPADEIDHVEALKQQEEVSEEPKRFYDCCDCPDCCEGCHYCVRPKWLGSDGCGFESPDCNCGSCFDGNCCDSGGCDCGGCDCGC